VTGEVDAASSRWAGVGPALEILALWALAGAQPVLELFGKNGEFFLASGAGPGEIVAFSVIVAFAVPVVLIAIETVVRLVHSGAGVVVHRVVMGLLGALLGLNVARQFDIEALLLALGVAVAFAALVLWLLRITAARSAMRYLGVAPLAFALLFVFASDAGSLVFTEDAQVVEVEAGAGGPVAVIVLDELPVASLLTRDGAVNEERFPNFARLADMSTWYRNATAVAPSTPESVPTVLTGLYPEEGLLPTSADRPVNIFTLLGGVYEVDAFEGVTDLCPDTVCVPDQEDLGVGSFFDDVMGTVGDAGVVYGHLTLPATLREDLPTLDQSWAGFLETSGESPADEEAPTPEDLAADQPADPRDDVGDFLRGRADEARARGGQGRDLEPLIGGYSGEAGTLLVGHDPFMPHRPWHITPSGAQYDAYVGGPRPGQEEWEDSPTFVRRVLQRHLLQVGYADTLLGELLDRFEAAGTLDEATIAITADHGMSFQPGGEARSPSDENVQEIYRVPLFIKGPGQAAGDGEVSDANALLVDVLPTVMDLIDIEPPGDTGFDGQSLVDPAFERAPDDKPIFYGNGPQTVPGDFTEVLPFAVSNADLVGDGDWIDLLQVGDAGPLVTRRVDAVERAPALDGTWEMHREERVREVAEGRARPIALIGELTLDDEGYDLPDQVVVAVDGVVAGVGDLDPSTGEFSALLDERRVQPGSHDVGLYLPDGSGGIQRIREG
jgi:hypothetical protein